MDLTRQHKQSDKTLRDQKTGRETVASCYSKEALISHQDRFDLIKTVPGPPDSGLISNSHADEDGPVTPAMSGRKLYRLVGVSFGLLCILQAFLNISLHLAFYSSCTRTPDNEAVTKNLTEEVYMLRRKSEIFEFYTAKKWVYFQSGFYYMSSASKSWQDSREDCLQRDADLVIINSKEEEDFIKGFRKAVWIGLTHGETRGTWRWVDGTPLNNSNRIPNRHFFSRNCIEINGNWNYLPCGAQNFWMCEKTVSL